MNRAGANDRVVVIGAINIDMVAFTGHLPGGGETAHEYQRGSGGKGANQAVAAARAGADVWLVSAVGGDDAGREEPVNWRHDEFGLLTSSPSEHRPEWR